MDQRYLPDCPFPPYAFVPGRHPHPVREPNGHLYGRGAHVVPPIDLHEPFRSQEFLFAVDLFNHGYYWEAHESWEGLWNAAGRTGPVALLLKALIKLSAAGVKSREGNPTGVQRHALRAAELFRNVATMPGAIRKLFAAINGERLIILCADLAERRTIDSTSTVGGLPVLGIRVELSVQE